MAGQPLGLLLALTTAGGGEWSPISIISTAWAGPIVPQGLRWEPVSIASQKWVEVATLNTAWQSNLLYETSNTYDQATITYDDPIVFYNGYNEALPPDDLPRTNWTLL